MALICDIVDNNALMKTIIELEMVEDIIKDLLYLIGIPRTMNVLPLGTAST